MAESATLGAEIKSLATAEDIDKAMKTAEVGRQGGQACDSPPDPPGFARGGRAIRPP